MIMKQLIGLCCIVLLSLSACDDEMKEPVYPPSEVKLNDVKLMTELTYRELQEGGMNPENYDFARLRYLFSADVSLNPYETYDWIGFYISPNRDYLSRDVWSSYNYNMMDIAAESWFGSRMWNNYREDWDVGIYHYRAVAFAQSDGVGFLDNCLEGYNGHSTLSELKSFRIPAKRLPTVGVENYNQTLRFYFNTYVDYGVGITKIGVCLNKNVNVLPTIEDVICMDDLTNDIDEELSIPLSSVSSEECYIRPFIITQNNDTIYGYVQRLQY